jgi:threonyl-tRNA synthetase
METTTVYRDEKAGELLGLSRVRSITQDDSHTFCTPDQINEILTMLVNIVTEFYGTIGMDLRVRLSFKSDEGMYLGDDKLWDKAQKIIKDVVEKAKLDYDIAPGEAAFYGPKIDFMGKDSLGRELQLATPQLDFVQPERFGLKYTAEDGSEKTPVMIHFAMLGSIERFLAAYIEHSMGRFPVWLAPEQVRLLSVNQDKEVVDFANSIKELGDSRGLRIEVDVDNESVGKKIRQAEVYKVPYTIVIGEQEVKTKQVKPRIREDLKVGKEEKSYTVEEFINAIHKESTQRVSKSSI